MTRQTKRGINHIGAMRRNRGLPQKHLVILLGLRSHRTLSNYESSAAYPTFRTALLLEIVLGAKLSELFPDLYTELQALVMLRAKGLTGDAYRQLVGRLLGKDFHDHTGAD